MISLEIFGLLIRHPSGKFTVGVTAGIPLIPDAGIRAEEKIPQSTEDESCWKPVKSSDRRSLQCSPTQQQR